MGAAPIVKPAAQKHINAMGYINSVVFLVSLLARHGY